MWNAALWVNLDEHVRRFSVSALLMDVRCLLCLGRDFGVIHGLLEVISMSSGFHMEKKEEVVKKKKKKGGLIF